MQSWWSKIKTEYTLTEVFKTSSIGLQILSCLKGNMLKKPAIFRLYSEEIVHICFDCFKEILFSKDLSIVSTADWILQENWKFVPADGCVVSVFQKDKSIPQICVNCQNFIINRLFESDTFTIKIE